jgi:hypothetical protein
LLKLREGPPTVPASFWDHELIRAAAAERHMGRLIAAYRAHPMHGTPISQETVGLWALKHQSQICKIEKGRPERDLGVLQFWVGLLGIPDNLLWFAMPPATSPHSASHSQPLAGGLAFGRKAPEPSSQADFDPAKQQDANTHLDLTCHQITTPAAFAKSSAPSGAAGSDETLVEVVRRVERLRRKVDPLAVEALTDRLNILTAAYDSADPMECLDELRRHRSWLDENLGTVSDIRQRQSISELATKVSGILGYIAVGDSRFDLSRAFLLEAFELAELANRSDLGAWVLGMQSFCEYYAGNYVGALEAALAGLKKADGGPQAVRLLVNGEARARGKLQDRSGVARAVETAQEILSHQSGPTVPSSIGLECYTLAQVAGNAATAYVSLADFSKVTEFVNIALSGPEIVDSPWGRSLVLLDRANAIVDDPRGDVDEAIGVAVEALAISAGRPVLSLLTRAREFEHKLRGLRVATGALHDLRMSIAGAVNPNE